MTAIRATFSDFKLVKTRKAAQLILEVPLEEADNALRVLGGLPQADREQWVGVAPIEQTAAAKKPMTLAQRAGMLCSDQMFQRFIGAPESELGTGRGGAIATQYIREKCNVMSRADIIEGTDAGDKFKAILTEYDAWRGRIGRPE